MNYEKPPPGNKFFSDDEPGVECSCLPDCRHIEYSFEVTPVLAAKS